jgi:Type I phosphodiesterase / nucleotide pyrophosphatase
VACVGKTCATSGGRPAIVPFCPLPATIKDDIEAGFRSGRSPDVLGVTGTVAVVGGTDGASTGGVPVTWPSLGSASNTAVPIVFGGPTLSGRAGVPAGTGLDAIAPTVAAALRLERPHPEIRAGKAVSGVTTSAPPRLILEIAWKGIGSRNLTTPGDWPYLRSLMAAGTGTLDGTTGSYPLDPAATLATIGTGGLPSQHGITGTLLRNQDERVVRAWSSEAPESVIATLPDDYDRLLGERPLVGAVLTDIADRGIVGDGWYVSHDSDPIKIARGPNAQIAAVAGLLRLGFGRDAVPDILTVVMQGSVRALDRELRAVVERATRAARGSLLVVVAGTGETGVQTTGAEPVPAATLVHEVDAKTGLSIPIVEAAVPGGLFLDEAALAKEGVTGQVAQEALASVSSPAGGPLMAQAFQGFAVSFARYC